MAYSDDGKKHDRNVLIAAVVLLVAVTYWRQWPLIIVPFVMVIWGLYFSPDLDLSDSGSAKGGACRAWHRWRRLGLGWFWKPYGYRYTHRSPLTHSIWPGTFIRLLYISQPAILILLASLLLVRIKFPNLLPSDLFLKVDLLSPKQIYIVLKEAAYWPLRVLLGCILGDIIHLLSDKIYPDHWIK